MNDALRGRVAVITGAARGIGREHALLFAREGARVVVNDLGGAIDGSGGEDRAARSVVEEIAAFGGEALASCEDVADFSDAARLIDRAIAAFGRVDVLVNNAGILRDSYLASMTEEQWDEVLRVHLRGHFAPMRHAAEHWKQRSKAGEEVRASIINTTSASGTLHANPGQANYGAAKAGIAALSMVAAAELARYGVRVNAIAPVARTRLSIDVPLIGDVVKPPEDPRAFDAFHARNVAPLVAYLAQADCPVTGKLFAVQGGWIAECRGWQAGREMTTATDWTIARIAAHFEQVSQ